jgi:hypothetical protein
VVIVGKKKAVCAYKEQCPVASQQSILPTVSHIYGVKSIPQVALCWKYSQQNKEKRMKCEV